MLALPAQLTHAQAAKCSEDLRAGVVASATGAVVVDASALTQFDSSALAVLLDCRREALRQGQSFAVRGLPERLRQLAGLYGVSELLLAATV